MVASSTFGPIGEHFKTFGLDQSESSWFGELVRCLPRLSATAVAVAAALAFAPAPVGHATSVAARSATRWTTQAGAEDGLSRLLSLRIPGVVAAGGKLYLDGRAHFFTGVNAYSATTDWTVNYGCGSMFPSLDTLFNALPAGSLVRTWAFQALGYNKFTHKIDFGAIDRLVDAARSHHDYLILALSDQAGTCDDGHFHDAAWYAGGYKQTYNDDGRGFATTMSYLRWVKTVAARYKNNRTVAVFEPVNEPEASNCDAGLTGGSCYGHNTCPSNATAVLRSFFDTIGKAIKTIDPRALVSTGVIGGSQCGIAGSGFSTVSASRYVDITTMHDYGDATTAASAGLLNRLRQARTLGKAFLVDEVGIEATTSGAGCMTLPQRAAAFVAKAKAARNGGADGYVPWNFELAPAGDCSLAIAAGDPALPALSAL